RGGVDRQRIFACDAQRERLDRCRDRERALAENFHGIDLPLIRAVVNRFDAIRQRIFEREKIASFDVDEFVVEIEQESLASFFVNEDLSASLRFDERLRGRAEESRLREKFEIAGVTRNRAALHVNVA